MLHQNKWKTLQHNEHPGVSLGPKFVSKY